MDKVFLSHKIVTEKEYTNLWENGLIIFDSNVLLDLYRLPARASKSLLDIFSIDKITDRIWIPFQVALEFTHNKLDAISDQKSKFNSVKNIISDSQNKIDVLYTELQKKLNDLQLKKRHSVIDPDSYINDELFKETKEKLKLFINELEQMEKKQPDVNDKDEIGNRVASIFESKIGLGFDQDKLNYIFKEGEIRYKEKIPPGFKDDDKEGFYLYQNKKIIKKYGDLLVWKEIIEKCKEEKHEFVMLVTGDVKLDWWHEKRGKRLGPRYELLNEIYFHVPSLKLFHIYDTSNFMEFAKKFLKINIDQQSIIETKDLLDYNKERSFKRTSSKLSVKGILRRIEQLFPGLNIKYSGFSPRKIYLDIPTITLKKLFSEIFSNVFDHSIDNNLLILFVYTEDGIVLEFKNKIKIGRDNNDYARGKGLTLIQQYMELYGGVNIHVNKNTFITSLLFDKKFILPPTITD